MQLVGIFVHGAEAGDEVIVVAFHDADVAGEEVDPGVVGMQTDAPVHLVVGQDRVVLASLVNLKQWILKLKVFESVVFWSFVMRRVTTNQIDVVNTL